MSLNSNTGREKSNTSWIFSFSSLCRGAHSIQKKEENMKDRGGKKEKGRIDVKRKNCKRG
jgi:hypothetical protein